jgi:hypothetical protein
VAAQVLATRLTESGLDAVPQARQPAGEGTAEREAAQRAWARELLAAWPARTAGARPRRLWSVLARRRLEQIAAGRSVGAGGHPLRLLWRSWRAARG